MLNADTAIGRMARLAAGCPSCAVVGNGPFASNLSEQIDAAFVVRCNSFALGFLGIGNRVDLNLSSLYHEVVPDRRVAWPILGAFPTTPSLFENYTTLRDMHVDWLSSRKRLTALGNQVWTYSEEDPLATVFADACISLGALPTVGFMGILLARLLRFRTIILTGFTFFVTSRAHYFAEDKVAFPPAYHHRPDRERVVVRQWVETDRTRIYMLDTLMASILEAPECRP